MVAVTRHTWEPVALMHGGGFLTALRATFTAWYGLGAVTGRYADRVDLLASYVRDPFPFVLAGRLLVLACSLASVVLAARLAAQHGGEVAGVVAALLLAVSFMHVRETHHVWLDVPAGAATLVVVAACLRAVRSGTLRDVAAAGVLGGTALATKYSTFPVVLPVLLAVWWSVRAGGGVVVRAITAGAGALVAFALLSPYAFLKLHETLALLVRLRTILFGHGLPSLSLATCVREGIGTGIAGLAVIGLVASARATPRPTAVMAAFPVAYLVVLASQSVVYSRYLAVVAPFAAIFAALGVVAIARAIAPARPLPVVVALVLVAGIPPALQSAGYVRFLALRDTRQLAADWIEAHVPPGTTIAVPNAVPYPNPTLPPDAQQLRFEYGDLAPALMARGLGDPARTYHRRYLAFFAQHDESWTPHERFVVTADHPIVIHDWYASPVQLERLAAAGAREVARFTGFVAPIAAGVVFEPVEFDYVPLAGFGGLVRPGPNLVVWELPQAAS